MGNFIKKIKVNTLILPVVGVLLLLTSFQNCGKFELSNVEKVVLSSFDFGITGTLEAPEKIRSHTRLIFVIDQSQSMALQGCPDDLDGPNPSLTPVDCVRAQGNDPTKKRLTVIQGWLQSLKDKNEPDTKVMIIPFSGGIVDENRWKNELAQLQFVSLDQAIARLDVLKKEQDDEVANPNQSNVAKRMGTSVPLRSLKYTQTKIEEEMRMLLSQKQLYTSLFEFYYISDGLYKPQFEHAKKALELAGCKAECLLDPDVIKCNSPYINVNNMAGVTQIYSMNGAPLSVTPSASQSDNDNAKICTGSGNLGAISVDGCLCLTLGNNVYKYLGRHDDQDPVKIKTTLVAISGLADYFMQGQINMNFVSVLDLAQATPPSAVNVFKQYKETIPTANLTTLVDMEKMIPKSATALEVLSYKIDKFYVVNLNVLQNPNGEYEADSDADGISDIAEAKNGTIADDERSTKDAEGVCLDGVAAKFGCRVSGCDAKLDADGDFLNECEEKTLGTSHLVRDTSADGILDYLKAIKGLNALMDASLVDSNSDGINDDQVFRWGLSPQLNYNVYEEKAKAKGVLTRKIETQVQFNGYVAADKGSLPSYRITVKNIPLVETLPYVQKTKSYYDRFKLDQIIGGEFLGPISHNANDNDVLFLVKVRSNEVKDRVYWMVYRKNMPLGGGSEVELDLSQFTELRSTRLELW